MRIKPDEYMWQAWTPAQAADVLEPYHLTWMVVGGWALDLWHGKQTRAHEDLEVAVLRSDLHLWVERLREFRIFSVGKHEALELRVGQDPLADSHQNWLLDGSHWRVDLMAEPGDEHTWICRRSPQLTLDRSTARSFSEGGIPYLRPEAVLLFKAKAARAKDEADFVLALPKLYVGAKAWLAMALQEAHPGHPWLAQLQG